MNRRRPWWHRAWIVLLVSVCLGMVVVITFQVVHLSTVADRQSAELDDYRKVIDRQTATLTAYMLCAAAGTLVGGLVAARIPDSDRVVAICMSVAALFLALCGTGVFGAVGTMGTLAATGFAVGIGAP